MAAIIFGAFCNVFSNGGLRQIPRVFADPSGTNIGNRIGKCKSAREMDVPDRSGGRSGSVSGALSPAPARAWLSARQPGYPPAGGAFFACR